MQHVTTQGHGQDGESIVNSYVMPRDMEIRGQIQAGTTAGMQALRNELIHTFIPHQDISILHSYGGETHMITARVERSPAFSFTGISSIQDYTVSLVAANPYWTDRDETRVDLAETVGLFHFPLVIPRNTGVVFGVKSTNPMGTVENASPIRIGMKYVFVANGRVVNPQLFNVKTRKYMRLLCNMEDGETITVQSGTDKTIIREYGGIREDYIGRIDLAGGGNTFLELDPGKNLFRYLADEGEGLLEVHISYRNLYTGV